MQKTTPFGAEMQKNIPGVISNDIKDNFSRFWIHTKCRKCRKRHPSLQKCRSTFPGSCHLISKTTSQGLGHTQNAENDTLCCRKAAKHSRSHVKRHHRQLHKAWDTHKMLKIQKKTRCCRNVENHSRSHIKRYQRQLH